MTTRPQDERHSPECVCRANWHGAEAQDERGALENTSDVDAYTPMLWATLNEDGKYVEYIRIRRQLTALRGALKAKAEEWRAAVKERGGSGCGCYGKNEMQRQCALELDAMRSSSASGAAPCSNCGCEERDHRGILTYRCPAGPAPQENIKALYYELLYEVARKHPGETRHQTALRYIRQAETPKDNGPVQAGPAQGEEPR
jgi:hypothetical protein